MTNADKNQLRAILRHRRRSLSLQQQIAARLGVTQLACSLPQWAGARRIALYHTSDGEIDTQGIADRGHTEEKDLYLPVIGDDRNMVFRHWAPPGQLLRNRFGILEPPADSSTCPVPTLDIIFLPLVGWDKTGGRLGMGAAYYDRALSGAGGPLLVGLAHQIQEVEKVPLDLWDIKLDVVITELKVHHCQAKP